MPPEKPPERGAETPLLDEALELFGLALEMPELPVVLPDVEPPAVTLLPVPPAAPEVPPEVEELVVPDVPEVTPVEAPLLRLRLVTALPAPVPPARPLTADCTPVTRCAGGFTVSEELPPETRGTALPDPMVDGSCWTMTVRGGS